MKKRGLLSGEEKLFRKRLFWRKLLLHAVLLIAFVVVLISSVSIFKENNNKRLRPQVNRAVIQVSKILPQLENNDKALRRAFGQVVESWQELLNKDELFADETLSLSTEEVVDEVVKETFSWMDRVTKLQVGREGFMVVVSKETNRILAHPNEAYVGREFFAVEDMPTDEVVSINQIMPWTKPENLDLEFRFIEPYKFASRNVSSIADIVNYYRMMLYGCVLDYRDTYIICGIPLSEQISYIFTNALIFSICFLIIMWLLVKWICLVVATGRETPKSLSSRLVSYSVLACVVLFGISLYSQILSGVTNDLKTMDRHADVAVETLNTYQEQRNKLNSLLDEFYMVQGKFAARVVHLKGRENMTREDMQHYADVLNVKYIYVFDQQGKVVVTNSPYDHYSLSSNSKEPSSQFRLLLEGVPYLVQEPVLDEKYGEKLQYVGVSTRNREDLCDGFVMIAIDPSLREELIAPLSVDTVLSNLTIGLPEYAIAVDKKTMEIAGTTGLGYKGDPVETMGITRQELTDNFNGYLNIRGTVYYAGVSESQDLFLVPIVRRSGIGDCFRLAVVLTLYAVGTSLLLSLLTLFRYRRDVLEGMPRGKAEAKVLGPEEEMDAEARGLFSGFSRILHTRQKEGFEERWHMSRIPKAEMTPEQRIGRIIYKLLLLFCLFILLPTLYASLNPVNRNIQPSNLVYVISGNWQKGVNIFAFTSCIFLLCAMYVAVVLIDRILYYVARASDTRVETICLLLRNALKYICVVIFVYFGLSRFGVDTQTLLASAGILSLMISFGAKDLVSDIIAGFFTIFEGSYKVGDFVTVGSWFGTVVEIGLRTTKVRFFSETKIFNNSSMRDIINSDGEVARMVLKMPISYDADLIEVEKILREELPSMMDAIPGLVKAPVYEGVESFEDSSVLLRITIFTQFGLRYRALRELNRQMKLVFDRRGIEIPFNQIVVHEAKDNDAGSRIRDGKRSLSGEKPDGKPDAGGR